MKSVLKEIAILFVLCLAIILVLGIIFYNYIPFNVVVPSNVQKYSSSDNIKEEVKQEVAEYPKQNVLYEITEDDLTLYRQTKSYNPGKANPFAADQTEGQATNTNSSGSSSSSSSSNSNMSAEQKASSKTKDTALK